MKNVLVTGASGFLGYHVVKKLNAAGIRPRALVPAVEGPVPADVAALRKQDIEEIAGNVTDPASLAAACASADTVLHLNFSLSLSGGPDVEKTLHEINVVGTRNLLDAATKAGVARVVVSSSALTVGLNREAKAIDESAPWDLCGLTFPYALSRREAELEALARPGGGGTVICAVNPTFTLGPEDFQGAPANALAQRMAKPFRLDANIGFSLLDVRDYADGVLRAAERGLHGQRYLLSGENVMPRKMLEEVCAVVGTAPSRFSFTLRAWMLYPILGLYELYCKLTGKKPATTTSVLQIWGRYAWYDTALARTDLGWAPRPLRDTLRDTLAWMKEAKS
jgi:dihydroflavonol-4-reductase